MRRPAQHRFHSGLFYMSTLSSPIGLLSLLLILLYALQHSLLLQRKMQIRRIGSETSGINHSRPALVTMADPAFQHCAVDILKSARDLMWRHPIFMLTIDFQDFSPDVVQELEHLGVLFVETNPIFDGWLEKSVENSFVYRTMNINKFRKMELFLNPIFRSFERLIFIDADGILKSELDPMVKVQFPRDAALLMRQNDKSFGKKTLWANEIEHTAMTSRQYSAFSKRFPDRAKTGASCWFVVNVKMLDPPAAIFSKSMEILCNYRAAFKLNDQTLLNLLFYEKIFLFPWCIWDVMPLFEDSDALGMFCKRHMHQQRALNGLLTFMFRHRSVKEKQECLASESVKKSRNVGKDSSPVIRRIKSFQEQSFFGSLLGNNKSCLESLQEWKQM